MSTIKISLFTNTNGQARKLARIPRFSEKGDKTEEQIPTQRNQNGRANHKEKENGSGDPSFKLHISLVPSLTGKHKRFMLIVG